MDWLVYNEPKPLKDKTTLGFRKKIPITLAYNTPFGEIPWIISGLQAYIFLIAKNNA